MIDALAVGRAMDVTSNYMLHLQTAETELHGALRAYHGAVGAGDQTGIAVHGARVAELSARVDGLAANPPPPAATIYANFVGQTLDGNLV
jgi:hypothetical protein